LKAREHVGDAGLAALSRLHPIIGSGPHGLRLLFKVAAFVPFTPVQRDADPRLIPDLPT